MGGNRAGGNQGGFPQNESGHSILQNLLHAFSPPRDAAEHLEWNWRPHSKNSSRTGGLLDEFPARPRLNPVEDPTARAIRTVFISDTHLGCRHAHAVELLDFLRSVEPESLYLVGDIIDGWKLKKSFAWKQVYNDILSRLHELAAAGTKIYLTPGNHDAFLRRFQWGFDFVTIRDEFVFEAADGTKYLVIHGDKFDVVEQSAQWVSGIASIGYDLLLSANWLFSRYFKAPASGSYSFSGRVKKSVKSAVRYISSFEQRLARYAVEQGCEGVICGHIHTPAHDRRHGIIYCNTGDWVENCTAFVEYASGQLELIHYFETPSTRDSSVAETRGENVLPRDQFHNLPLPALACARSEPTSADVAAASC
ncbi:MAG: UDP-2,3-diacylglucosamine diphosphatase [Planctomyces sp.]|nr:UDP-2,3-diacylglucosamine diphosphatase [Planctomyces sp.]